jgi:hypothetical protein
MQELRLIRYPQKVMVKISNHLEYGYDGIGIILLA